MSKILGFNQKCPNCNSLLPNLATHCMQCGWNLNISDIRTTKCQKCGKELRVFEKFCPNCGQPKNTKYHQPIICKKCKREITWDSKVCNYCQTPIKGSLFLEHIKSHKLYFSIFYIILIIASVTTIYISHYFTRKNVHNSYNEIIQSSENANKIIIKKLEEELTQKDKELTEKNIELSKKNIQLSENNIELTKKNKELVNEIDELKKYLEKNNYHLYKLDKNKKEHYTLQLQKQQKKDSSSNWKMYENIADGSKTFILSNNSGENSIIVECDGDATKDIGRLIVVINNKKSFYDSGTGFEFFIDKKIYYPPKKQKLKENNDTWNELIYALSNGNQIGVFFKGNIVLAFTPSKDSISNLKSMGKYCFKR